MRVEFLVNTEIGDGRQIFIDATEFFKAQKDDDEFNSFASATEAFFAFYGANDFIHHDEYEKIAKALSKNGAVIITLSEDRRTRKVIPEVYVSNNNRLKSVEL